MKISTLFLIFMTLSIPTCIYSQIPEVLQARTSPSQPSITDYIYIIDSVRVGDSGNSRTSYIVSVHSDTITITSCYRDTTGFSMITFKKDTTPIGILSPGLYHCIIYSRMHIPQNDTSFDCSLLPYRDTLSFTFTVSQYPTGIADVSDNSISIYPVPASDKISIRTSLSNLDLTITDITGRSYAAPHNAREIDISALASGVYYLRLQSREGIVIRRFVKE